MTSIPFSSVINKAKSKLSYNLRQFSTAIRRHIEDEGDWFYSSEWWGAGTASDAQTVFREISDKGNGVVSVLAYPSSKPENKNWHKVESWLQQRFAETNPSCEKNGFGVIGYQWRTLHFNDDTRQSTVKIMAAYEKCDPASVFYMQQPHCLAVPYVKSMISAGLATITSCNYDLSSAVCGKKIMNILCIGHGGGSIPLFLASKIQGAVVHIVEIDPLVISASTQAMGFPRFAVMTMSGERACTNPDPISTLLWKGIHERLLLHESDAEKFISETTTLYDIVFIDAYDGEDIFPHKLWDPNSTFLKALANQLHPEHGTVVLNLHSDTDLSDDSSVSPNFYILPMGKYVSSVCKAYKDVLLGDRSLHGGLAYTVSVPWVCNTSLTVSRGFGKADSRDVVLNSLLAKSLQVENILDLPFSCLQYIKRGFNLID
ncbi:hypothetical protein ACH5RR_032894 [Cinchona calisaya]|uniref:S-adenosyl-L-methionine-dependent methyltransferase n=1 Tax=Cinchona calisaya TaxID=153742 RepID=A0ABD2YNU1_9GENT